MRCAVCFQFFTVAKAVKHTDGIDTEGLCADDIVLSVTDHNDFGFIGYALAFQNIGDDLCLCTAGAILIGADSKIEIFGKADIMTMWYETSRITMKYGNTSKITQLNGQSPRK